jgi:hypothetical protein
MASLGVTALAAGFLAWRVNALDRRLATLGRQLSDLQALIDAEQKAYLQSALDHLAKFERERSARDLDGALNNGTYATNLYRNLVERELGGGRRLVALNQCGRYYLLALTTQVRCLVLGDSLEIAEDRLGGEGKTLAALAQAAFHAVLGRSPEVYLDPRFQADGVTLATLTDVFRQARLAGVAVPEFADASATFEHLRPRVVHARIPSRTLFRPLGRAKKGLLDGLKYLAACLEDVNRVAALRLRIADARRGGYAPAELERALAAARADSWGSGGDAEPSSLFAYAFP